MIRDSKMTIQRSQLSRLKKTRIPKNEDSTRATHEDPSAAVLVEAEQTAAAASTAASTAAAAAADAPAGLDRARHTTPHASDSFVRSFVSKMPSPYAPCRGNKRV